MHVIPKCFLPLAGWVKIEADSVSCANFHQYELKQVDATFSYDGVKGSIKFAQDHPYTATILQVKLEVSLQHEVLHSPNLAIDTSYMLLPMYLSRV